MAKEAEVKSDEVILAEVRDYLKKRIETEMDTYQRQADRLTGSDRTFAEMKRDEEYVRWSLCLVAEAKRILGTIPG